MRKQDLIASLDAFTVQYIETALWSSTVETEDGSSDGSFEHQNYSIDDLTVSALRTMARDCRDFQKSNAALLESAEATLAHYNAGSAGHDFWLTRNRHGAGFWDRGLGVVGDELTKAAHPYGEAYLRLHRGKIYHD